MSGLRLYCSSIHQCVADGVYIYLIRMIVSCFHIVSHIALIRIDMDCVASYVAAVFSHIISEESNGNCSGLRLFCFTCIVVIEMCCHIGTGIV